MKVTYLLTLAMALTASMVSTEASAQVVLAYDMETGLDGFGANGGGVTVAPSTTIGVTSGATAMRVSVVPGATFVGALTGNVAPSLGDPPGVDEIIFDLTIDTPFAGGFASLGVTVFGATQPGPGQLFGLPVQFSSFVPVETLAPGTYTRTLSLNSATHPTTFAGGQSFNQIFGGFGTGPNDIIPTGFQFFINKSGTANSALTLYIDNVRTNIPEPATASMILLAAGTLGVRRRR